MMALENCKNVIECRINRIIIKAIFYDLDGTLVDARDWHYIALNQALYKVCGFKIDEDDHIKNFDGLSTKTKLLILLERGVISEKHFSSINELKQKYTLDNIDINVSRDHMKIDMHNTIKSYGIKSYCVTNCSRLSAELMLSKTGQISFLEFIVTNEDTLRNKPFPDPYLLALKMSDMSPNNVLVIEDSEKGIASATAAGIQNVVKINCASELTSDLIFKKCF